MTAQLSLPLGLTEFGCGCTQQRPAGDDVEIRNCELDEEHDGPHLWGPWHPVEVVQKG